MLQEISARKVNGLCTQNNLTQIIIEPSHYTEHSTSVIDLIFVSNQESILISGTGEPFLDQNIRYHCPVFAIVKYNKPVRKSFYRHIWRYELGDYEKLRTLLSHVQLNQLIRDDINIYTQNVPNVICGAAQRSIPNKKVCIRTGDAPWMNNFVKSKIRK